MSEQLEVTPEAMKDLAERRSARRADRRAFFQAFGAAASLSGAAYMAAGSPAVAQTAPSDADVLNFALNLEYLEAQFYSFAVNGTGLPNNLLTGTGTQGAVRPGRQVTFTDTVIQNYAREIAADEIAHVAFLRQALGTAAVAQPEIDVSVSPTSAFSNAARAAGLIGAGQSFDPYASENNFLLGSFIFEDVGVTAYKGASPLITNKTFLEAAAGILAVEAYHAAEIRTVLSRRGITTQTGTAPPGVQNAQLIAATEAISNARDSLDGASDIDQGVAPIGTGTTQQSNIVPTDANGLAFSRTTGQVLNIVYLNRAAVTAGGFFPNGVNGPLRTSAAN